MVVVEQEMAVMENLSQWSFSSYMMMSLRALYNCDKIRNFLGNIRKNKSGAQRCQHMKPSHELDERVVVAESASSFVDWARRYWGGVEEPEVSCQPSHVGANGDEPLPIPLYLVLNHKGDEIACKYLRDGGRTDALERLGLYEAVLGAKVCQQLKEKKCMWQLRACSSFSSRNSSVYRPRAAPNSGTLSWWIHPPRQNWTVLGSSYLVITVWRWNVEHSSIVSSKYVGSIIPKNSSQGSPNRCSGQQLRVGPEVFGTVLLGALGETVGEGDGFLRLGPQKRTIPSSSSKQYTPVFLGRVGSHGLVARSCLASFASPAPPVLAKSFSLFSHGLKHARVLGRVSMETPVFKISISSAELGMTHLHRTEWKNTEYRKRDFLILCGSDNVGICGI
ncbi:hypothetical protein GOBAR_AA21787 [Gossypium barbadense]|uniref:Uncharacterized protein n=1 Tax=Gossypium barbadense TaxID=3634 RepID=A0A2P5X6D5_GOSBA|nr:hypothetical protein GOBAR_AA21787 [Gossypium barbadense]